MGVDNPESGGGKKINHLVESLDTEKKKGLLAEFLGHIKDMEAHLLGRKQIMMKVAETQRTVVENWERGEEGKNKIIADLKEVEDHLKQDFEKEHAYLIQVMDFVDNLMDSIGPEEIEDK
jgi:hypothetical protein